MQYTAVSFICLLASSFAYPEPSLGNLLKWRPPQPDDSRSPCPMLNALANHGFLPHDGRNLTEETVVGALKDGINFDQNLGKLLFEQARSTNPRPNATFFTLDHLNRHNVMEHDASLSRLDDYFGNNHDFNQEVFDTTKAYWTDEILDPMMLVNGKIFRQIESRARNPNYTFTSATETFSLTELAFPIVVFGDLTSGTVRRDFVEYLFENERLPTALGWSKKKSHSTLEDVVNMSELVGNATNLFSEDKAVHRRDSHIGMM